MKEICKSYFKKNIQYLVLFAGVFGALFIVYWLYGLPWGPAIYTSSLIAAMLILFISLDVYAYYKRALQLLALKKQAAKHLGCLPAPFDLTEECYQEIVRLLEARSLQAEKGAIQTAADAKRYYTLWSHQIKTPIAALNLLLQEDMHDKATMEQELLKIEQYVEMVLQYQRLGGSSNDLLLQEYPLEPLVKQAIKKISTLFIHKKIGIAVEPMEGYRILTDEKWMVFILEQLLTNAVKYTRQGSVSIRLAKDAPDTLLIEDSGIGILPEDLPRVFEWGYTGYNGRQDKRSTGIGLSLCKQALDLLGHSISISSVVGQGTTVRLNLARQRFDIE